MKVLTPESREVELEFGWSGLTLAGTLHLPEGSRPGPTVLMMQGSLARPTATARAISHPSERRSSTG